MTIWLTARGAGLSALSLLTMTLCLGAIAHRLHPSPRVLAQYVHRATAALGIGVLVLHVATILADSYAHVGLTGAVIPFTSSFRATAVGIGTIAAYLFLLVSALGMAKARFAGTERGAKIWRRLHMSSYPAWAMAIGHGYLSGTDSSVGWVRLLYVVCIAVVVASVAVSSRARKPPTSRGPRHVAQAVLIRQASHRELVNR